MGRHFRLYYHVQQRRRTVALHIHWRRSHGLHPPRRRLVRSPCLSSCDCLTHPISTHFFSYVWSGGGVSTSDLLASSSIFQWTVTHPPTGEQSKLDNPLHKQRLTCICETKEHIWTGCKGKVVCVWSKKLAESATSVPKVVHFMQDMPSAPLDIIFAGSVVWLCAEDGYVRCWKDTSDPVLLNVFHVVHEQRVSRMLHVPNHDQLWCVRDDGTVSILDVSNGLFQSQNIVHMFKNAAGDRYVGEIKESSNLADPMQMAIADDDSERCNFVKEGHGELHYANKDLYVGQFRLDMRHGYGVLRQANGRRFFGQWKNDVRDGPGIDVQTDGTCFDGIFSKNVRKGCAYQHISCVNLFPHFSPSCICIT